MGIRHVFSEMGSLYWSAHLGKKPTIDESKLLGYKRSQVYPLY